MKIEFDAYSQLLLASSYHLESMEKVGLILLFYQELGEVLFQQFIQILIEGRILAHDGLDDMSFGVNDYLRGET